MPAELQLPEPPLPLVLFARGRLPDSLRDGRLDCRIAEGSYSRVLSRERVRGAEAFERNGCPSREGELRSIRSHHFFKRSNDPDRFSVV